MPTYSIREAPVLERRSSPDRPAVVFDKVSLAFDDKVVLKEISFTLLPGHTKIILGASGSGKSTILKLILGLWKPDGGEIWVHGSHIDKMPEHELMKVRNHLGTSPRERSPTEESKVPGRPSRRQTNQAGERAQSSGLSFGDCARLSKNQFVLTDLQSPASVFSPPLLF